MSGINRAIVRRIAWKAYEQGWTDRCLDGVDQQADPAHPIGERRPRTTDALLARIDQQDLLGLRGEPR